METLLIAVTVLSLAMAIGMAVLTTRLLREDRARADARVAALTQLSAEPELEPPPAFLDEPVSGSPRMRPAPRCRRRQPRPARRWS